MKKVYLLATSFLLLTLISYSQTTQSFTPDRDATIFSESGTAANGTGALFVGRINNGSSYRRVLVHFDLSSIPSNATVTSASLTFNVEQPHGGTFNLSAHKLNSSWGEGTSIGQGSGGGQPGAATNNDATWTSRFFGTANNWASPGGDFEATASATITNNASPFQFTSSQLVADVQSWITSSSTNHGWVIKNVVENTGNGNTLRLSSKETGSGSTMPTLSVTYSVTAPVSLKSFFGSMKGTEAKLQWQTASEQNSDFFEVQHSTNGERFTKLGTVKAAGNSAEARSYSFTHTGTTSGKSYYRLVQHDIDGKFSYSNIVMLSSDKHMSLQVSPNPADKVLKVVAQKSLQDATYNIVSTSGQIIRFGVLNNQQIDIANLNTGMYQLIIQTPDKEILRSQFIKR